MRFKLGKIDYPLSKQQRASGDCQKLHSCIMEDDSRLLFLPSKGPKPAHPEDGAPFWDELLEVAYRVDMAKKKTPFSRVPKDQLSKLWPEHIFEGDTEFVAEPIKSAYNVSTAHDLAKLVEADWPTDIMNKMAGWLLSKGYKQRDLFGIGDWTPFTDGVVGLASVIGQLIHQISPTMFAHKWYHGRLRPEEAAHLWAKGEIKAPDGIDLALSKLIDKDAVAKDQSAFGVYKAPPHPSFPAMHSSVASKHLLFAVWFELDEEGFRQMRKAAYNVAVGRDFGGVHYRSDDLFGLAAGERAISIVLPKILSEMGANIEGVHEIIKAHQTDWAKGVFE